jgi:hypothetical protein
MLATFTTQKSSTKLRAATLHRFAVRHQMLNLLVRRMGQSVSYSLWLPTSFSPSRQCKTNLSCCSLAYKPPKAVGIHAYSNVWCNIAHAIHKIL